MNSTVKPRCNGEDYRSIAWSRTRELARYTIRSPLEKATWLTGAEKTLPLEGQSAHLTHQCIGYIGQGNTGLIAGAIMRAPGSACFTSDLIRMVGFLSGACLRTVNISVHLQCGVAVLP